MSNVMIRIGASLDRSTTTVFTEIAEAAKRANRTMADEARRAAKEEDRAWKEAQKEMAKWEREAVAAKRKAARETEQIARQAAREEERIARQKIAAMMKVDREMTAFAERQARDRARAEERAADDAARAWVRARERQKRDLVAANRAMGHAVGALGGRALGFGASVMGDLAGGAGVNFSLSSHAMNASDLETRAMQLSNSGYMPNDPRNSTRVSSAVLAREAYATGTATGTGANDVMAGMQAMVGKTGDLQGARDTIGEIAKLSKATGSNLEDMASAAADVSNQLGPGKSDQVIAVMRQIAGQGKLGAVEIKDLASQMAKVAAQANLMEGDASKNIALFGALSQEARAKGGAASASQATTAVGSLMDTFSKGARLDAFKALNIRTTGAGGKIRNVEDIIIESLQKTQHGGNADLANRQFGGLFATAQSRRAVRGIESTFREAYAGATGTEQEKIATATKAAREELDRLTQAAMDQKEVEDSFAKAMQTSQSTAQQWDNTLQQTTGELQSALLPAFKELAPVIVSLAGKVSSVLGGSPTGDAAADAGEHANALIHAAGAERKASYDAKVTAEEKRLGRKLTPEEKKHLAMQQADPLSPALQAEINKTAKDLKGKVGAHRADASKHLDEAQHGWGSKALKALDYLPRTGLYGAAAGVFEHVTGTGVGQGGRTAAKGQVDRARGEMAQVEREQGSLDVLQKLVRGNSMSVALDPASVNALAQALKGGGPRPPPGGGGGQNNGLDPTE